MTLSKTTTCSFAVGLLACSLIFPVRATDVVSLSVDWDNPINTLKTIQTVDVEPTPIMRAESPIRAAIFDEIKKFNTKYIRYHAWISRPRLTVAELEPPTKEKTSWDFSLIDPEMLAFLEATKGRQPIINFSTIPTWMFKTASPVPYPRDPNEITYTYGTTGTELKDPTCQQVSEYFVRFVSWYTRGGFTDENGKYHRSGYHYDIPWWGVLNESDIEHRLSAEQYTRCYDAIVSTIRKINPNTKFVGYALARLDPDYLEYFLNPKNHQADIPVDMVAYHHYAKAHKDQTIADWPYAIFDQVDGFIEILRFAESIRKRLSPSTLVNIDEYGTFHPSDIYPNIGGDPKALPAIPELWWNLTGAADAYRYLECAKLGIDVLGATYITGSPGNFPGLSLLDWKTGKPNARFRVLQMLNASFAPGDKLMSVEWAKSSEFSFPPTDVSAQAFLTANGKRLLLINKRARAIDVEVRAQGAVTQVSTVDEQSGNGPPRIEKLAGNVLRLRPFAVAVVSLK